MRMIPLILLALAQARGAAQPPAAPQPNPNAPLYQATGEQYRIYNFPGTGESIPYRLFVPSRWSPAAKLPMLVTLRAGNTVDGPYRAANDLVRVAAQRGYIVVAPMGDRRRLRDGARRHASRGVSHVCAADLRLPRRAPALTFFARAVKLAAQGVRAVTPGVGPDRIEAA